MYKGSCCCGEIRFELTAKPSMLGTCHCTRCRKSGTSTMFFVKKSDLKWISGENLLQVYKAVPPYKYDRYFCKNCGTSFGEVLGDLDSFPIAANLMDDDIDMKNEFHEFVSEKPSWLVIGDDGKQFHDHPEF